MSDEFLMYVDLADCHFLQEAELLPTQLDDAVKNCEDTTTQIIRMDHKTWCGEDVTEDIANAWLNTHEPLPNAENILPAFVAESGAWQLYCDDFNTRFDDPKNPRKTHL